MAEDIYEKTPILFADDHEKNEYQKKLEQKTKKFLESTESENVTEALVKMIYGEDFGCPSDSWTRKPKHVEREF